MIRICSVQLVLKGDDFVGGIEAVASGIAAHEAELKQLMVEKDAIIAEKDVVIIQERTASKERDNMIGKLEYAIVSMVQPDEIAELEVRLSLSEAKNELERRKARHFCLQAAAVNAAKQTLQYQVDSDSAVIKGLQVLLDTARGSVETTLAQERSASYENLKVQKADAFCLGFEEGSRPLNERNIKSPKKYQEQIGMFEAVNRFVSTPANLEPPEITSVASPSFNPDSFFASSEPSQ